MNPTNRSRNSSQDDDKSRTEASDKKPVLLIGFDWGTNTSFIQGVNAGATEPLFKRSVRTVVGYAKDGIVDDLLPGNAKTLFGDEAVKYRLHLSLQSPMVDGVVANLPVARDFARHLRSLIESPAGTEIRAVIGIPANADQTARENMRQVVNGLFDRLLLIPEPFLAALGHRDETKLNTPGYVDPVRNSLFIDIGAGTSDICMVQGYYPTAEDQVSLSFAGDKVDILLNESIKKTYPDCDLPLLKVREIKEQHSYVGKPAQPVIVSVLVGGKVRKLDLTEEVGAACDSLLQRIFTAMSTLIARASYDSVNELLQNIILTGGGSRIRNIDVELQRLLTEEGFDKPVVRSVGENYKEYVSKGALKAARQAREDQWQKVII